MDNSLKASENKRVREQIKCPVCPSSDAFTVYDHDNGTVDGYCFSCAHYTKTPYGSLENPSQGEASTSSLNRARTSEVVLSMPTSYATSPSYSRAMPVSLEDGLSHPILPIPSRGISQSTAERYGVRTGVSPSDGETPIYILFPRYNEDSEQVGWKTRNYNDKQFTNSGGSNVQLFGKHLLKPQGKKLWITEGETDCLSVYQVLKEGSSIQGWEPPVVSIPDGCTSAAKVIAKSLPFLEKYEEVIIVFDSDPAGRKAREECCKVLAGNVSYVDLPMKDPNEMLLAGRGQELKWLLLTNTKKYQPDGVLNARDAWERYKDKQLVTSYPYPLSMPGLNQKTQGAKPGSIITVTSGTGMGKTQFLKELLYHFLQTTDENIAGMFLEEDATETIQSLLSIHLNKRLNLHDTKRTHDEEAKAFNDLFSSGRLNLYDYFGGMDDSSLISKLRYFAVTGHRFIFLDHLSIVVSEYAAQGGERERIDSLMTKLAKFVKEFGVVLYLVVHLRKTDNSSSKSFEEGLRPSLDDLRGSGSLKQLSWEVLGLSRNQQHEDPTCARTTEVAVLKCRHTGRTGVADYLQFDDTSGRLYGVSCPVNYYPQKRSNKYTSNNNSEEF